MRSIWRPAYTASSIGRKAYSAISTPTVNGVAPSWMPKSAIVMRLPTKATWVSTVSTIASCSVTPRIVAVGEAPTYGRRRVAAVTSETPRQVTTMPASVRWLGTTSNIRYSSTTAKIGVRYRMLVTLVAWPWRIRVCRAFTAKIEARTTRKAIEANSAQLQVTWAPSTAKASGASSTSEAANWTQAAL